MTIQERLEKLEMEFSRANRRNRHLLAVLAFCLGLAVVAWVFRPHMLLAQSVTPALKEVRASRFVLEDAKQRVRSVLEMSKDGTGLTIFDEKGTLRLQLIDSNEDGPRLDLCDKTGTSRVGLVSGEYGPSLCLSDEKSIASIGMGLTKDGPVMVLIDEKGRNRAQLSCLKDSGPKLDLSDGKGRLRATFGAAETTTPDGKSTMFPESSLLLFGPDGKVRWQTP